MSTKIYQIFSNPAFHTIQYFPQITDNIEKNLYIIHFISVDNFDGNKKYKD